MPPKDKYSDPKLRDEVKEEIHNSDKGGAPGQWSARKAQMMASEYKKRGGGYNTEKSEQDQSQKHLSEWTEEEWQTKEGSGHAKQADGTEKRYLPKKAWEQMSEGEKEETDQKKQAGSKEGKQFVGNTEKAKESRENANQEEKEKYEEKKAREKEQKKGGEEEEEDAAEQEGDEEYQEDEEGSEEGSEAEGESEGEEASAGQKRTRGQQNGSKKSQKDNAGKGQSKGSPKKQQNGNKSDKNDTVGSKHQKNEDPAPKGSADRLPKKGQQVHWKAMPGFVDGKVTDILTGEQEVDGKNVKASEKDPRIVLKSNSSGKICVHKPEACYYD